MVVYEITFQNMSVWSMIQIMEKNEEIKSMKKISVMNNACILQVHSNLWNNINKTLNYCLSDNNEFLCGSVYFIVGN